MAKREYEILADAERENLAKLVALAEHKEATKDLAGLDLLYQQITASEIRLEEYEITDLGDTIQYCKY